MTENEGSPPPHFIRKIVDEDVAAGKNGGRVVTRFPPEPNGYLHIGHAKSICLNFGLAAEYAGGICYLRFDDTNPSRESEEYVEAIKEDVRWLGFDWDDRLRHASDYFQQLFDFALALIGAGTAYVCSLTAEEIRTYRGTLTEPGRNSPYRDRSPEESLDLFHRMRAGEFADGEHVLRARIDMASPNLNLRDPTLYRIRRASHQQTGDAWCIYPMYDFAHTLSDAIEGVTHSLCTLEFEDHRPLYDWLLDNLPVPCHPQQIEFSRLSLAYTVVSKRLLNALVEGGHVDGWDDPRMPTLVGMRRRGFSPAAIREFCNRIGITKKDNFVEMGVLESCIREDLDHNAPRVMGVLRPLRLIIENYPEGAGEELEAKNHPNRPEMGARAIPFSRELYIEREDFMEDPPRKFFRLAPGREVRLRYAYFVRCVSVERDPETGDVATVHCTYDPETRGGAAPDGRKVKGTIHWVSAPHSIAAEARLYDRLFRDPSPKMDGDDSELAASMNPGSLEVSASCRVEPSLATAVPGSAYQFERQGYFCRESSSRGETLVFNRTVTLRDSWAKVERASRGAGGAPVPAAKK